MNDQPATEWGVRWRGTVEFEQGDRDELEKDGGEEYARRVAKQYRASTELVQREVRYGPWKAAE
jgi:hypothetical protein